VQRSSEGIKKGDTNKAHVNAIDELEKYILHMLDSKRYHSKKDYKISIPRTYLEPNDTYEYHQFDLTICDNTHMSAERRKLYLEIDGEIHSHPARRKKDNIINEVVKLFYPKDRLIRFHKDELNGTDIDFQYYVNSKLLGLTDPYKTQVI
jgi:hypothetical protein